MQYIAPSEQTLSIVELYLKCLLKGVEVPEEIVGSIIAMSTPIYLNIKEIKDGE